jgi:hypothetical protein
MANPGQERRFRHLSYLDAMAKDIPPDRPQLVEEPVGL